MSDETTDIADAWCKVLAFWLALARSLYDAWVLLMLWGWFIVPLGAPRINFWHAYGIDVFVSYFLSNIVLAVYADKQKTGPEQITGVFQRGVAYTLILGLGYCAHSWGG